MAQPKQETIISTAPQEPAAPPDTDWSKYPGCATCGSTQGDACRSLTTNRIMTRPHRTRKVRVVLDVTDPDVVAERQRIAEIFMRFANQHNMCSTAEDMWQVVFPGMELRDAAGFNRKGYDRDGYNRDGFNRDGFDAAGFDRRGFNRSGFHRDTGRTIDGFDREGWNADGYNRNGIHRDTGRTVDGFDRNGFDHEGYNRRGYDRDGYNRDGFDGFGHNRDGFNRDGFDALGYDREGFNHQGLNRHSLDRNGVHPRAGERPNENAVWCVACTCWEDRVSRRPLSPVPVPLGTPRTNDRGPQPPNSVWCDDHRRWEYRDTRRPIPLRDDWVPLGTTDTISVGWTT